MDFRTRASHRVVVSTFGAESSAAVETHGIMLYSRALICEALSGRRDKHLESDMPTRLITDCKSLYDHLKSDGKVPDDRHTAIWVAVWRCGVGAGPQVPPH